MAIFDVNSEQTRQSKTIAPDIVGKGEGAGFMRALGYDPTTGQENKWGKVLHAPLGFSTATNLIAGGISKGSDINQVLKEGRDEAISYDLNKAALGVDIFKMAASAGLAGGVGSGLSNSLAQTLVGSAPGMMAGANAGANAGQVMNSVSASDLTGNKLKNLLSGGNNIGGVANSLTRTIQGGMAYNNSLDEASKGLYTQTDEPFSYL